MATAVKATTVFDQVLSHAETIQNDADHDLRTMEVGDEWRQGDLVIIRKPDDFASTIAGLEEVKRPSMKLAPGSTQGSRHTLDSLRGVTVYRLRDGNALDGPVLKLAESRSVLHPEHGNVMNLPTGCYAIQYARAFADELRAVQD